ncbi:type 4b pilus protein PilO2 [Pusillimonas sp. MFBS29]|uniref:type 4b pilus protein PilO2 n=1 Tax=Pusillimonas sp. MFBS29 TaxID=2886690 RepID=UPI001D0FEB99|nr:type 4b pilus protein PilO2 [Pusillimonas sp. MFBS29]MCC2595317.1 type 4b pilus protein PilO2 [Pusillimonas sp. MFBS29]
MNWIPLMGDQPAGAALKLARKHKATHAVLPLTALGAVGLVSLRRRMPDKGTTLYSAAQNMAQLFPSGSLAFLIELPQAGYWLLALHEGVVVARTDQIYHSPADADEVIGSLRLAYPQIQVLADPAADGLPTQAALEAASSTPSQLHPLRRWQAVLPWPVQAFVLVLVLVLLLPRAWHVFAGAHASVAEPAPPDPLHAWRQAVSASAGQRQVHGSQGTRILLESLHDLPGALGGWVLRQAVCTAQGLHWQCNAEYERQHVQASNESFLAVVPSEWVVEFTSLDRVAGRWQLHAHSQALSHLSLPSSNQNERHLLSSLQGMRPAFARMQIGLPQPVPLAIPTDAHDRPLPRPKELAVYQTRSVHINGPLRSASLLASGTMPVAWHKATLNVAQTGQAGLNSSTLNLSLQGLIYETDREMAGGPDADRCTRPDSGSCVRP